MSPYLSPYALLKRSKPQPPDVFVTQYDLYSAAQQAAPPPQSPTHGLQEAAPPDLNPPAAHAPASKTHYISAIKARHARAARTAFVHPSPASFQQPSI